MKKIVLIYPKFPSVFDLNIPIGLLHLGTYLLEKNFSVVMVDCTMQKDYKQVIANNANNASYIGISIMTAQIPHAMEIGNFVKNDLKVKAPIICGGVHPTLYPKRTLKEPFVDYVVIGEGEIPFEGLLRSLEQGDPESLSNIPGVGYIDRDGMPYITSPSDFFDYNLMPPFDYSLLSQSVIDDYKKTGSYFPLLTSRGCPYRCAFCINVVTKNTKWRAFTAERLVKEIKRILELGLDRIWFWDENFFVGKNRLKETLDLIENNALKFSAYAAGRADYIHEGYLNHELLKRMRNLGFTRMGFGFESGSAKTLDYLQKDITVRQIERAAQWCSEAGIRVSASFMIGLPQEEEVDIRQTVSLIGRLAKICGNIGINGPQFYRPYPGSKIYEDCLRAGWKEPEDFAEWSRRIITDFYQAANPYNIPWIINPAFVDFVYFYAYTLSIGVFRLIGMFFEFCRMTKRHKFFLFIGALGLTVLSLTGKLRYRFGFYRFLLEKKIFSRYHPNLDY